jgi:exodeoxyribonuclease-5
MKSNNNEQTVIFLRTRIAELRKEKGLSQVGLAKEQSDCLFHAVLEDYSDISVKRERMKKIKVDPWYNALQVKYAYAVTCHKAQGGQWQRVFIDQGYMTEEMLTPDYFRWLYTAFTRATGILYLVNWPKEQIEEE